MKKLLYILLFLQIISGVFIFFMLIGSDAFTAVLAGFICILQIALTISVIRNTEDIEQLNEETTCLRTKLKGLENIVNPYNSPESAVPFGKRNTVYTQHTGYDRCFLHSRVKRR